MKTLTRTIGLLAMLCLAISFSFAQPVITQEVVFALGDRAPVTYLQGTFDPGPAGAEVSWDFSGMTTGVEFEWEATGPRQYTFCG